MSFCEMKLFFLWEEENSQYFKQKLFAFKSFKNTILFHVLFHKLRSLKDIS